MPEQRKRLIYKTCYVAKKIVATILAEKLIKWPKIKRLTKFVNFFDHRGGSGSSP